MNSNQVFYYRNEQLFVEDIAINDLAKQIATPFYCYSSRAITDNFIQYQQAFAKQCTLICYAVKANSNQAILTTLAKLGAGADVVSLGEIKRALAANIPANKIVFSGVAKTAQEIEFALKQNIFQFNIESEPELQQISAIATRLNKIASVSFRINPDVNANTHAKITTGKAENKFGIPIDKARDIYKKAANLPNIKVQGVDVHIGSQLTEITPFKEAFAKVAELVKTLKTDGHTISVIDIGGGLGIEYKTNENIPKVTEYAELVRQQLATLECKIIVEPGRSIVGNAGVLVSKVVYVKKGEQRQFLILDAGMNDLIRPSMYDAYHDIIKVTPNSSEQTYDIVGPVCETGDTFAKARKIASCQQGDLVAIKSCGAYGAVMSSTYNTRLPATEVMINNNQWCVIKDRPSYEEYINADKIPVWLQ
jgi:diaminopimelate decarboxylase